MASLPATSQPAPKPRFIDIPRERRSNVPFTEEELNSIRGGLTAEEYRWKPDPPSELSPD
jgi:hypothetical protein